MATGTGKTFSVFQIIWRLWKAEKVKRVLFLADQTVTNDFKPFGLVMTKVCNRDMDPSYEIYIALYQAEGEVDITAWFGGQRSITAWEEVMARIDGSHMS